MLNNVEIQVGVVPHLVDLTENSPIYDFDASSEIKNGIFIEGNQVYFHKIQEITNVGPMMKFIKQYSMKMI